jgi:hypothetical protein
MNMIAVALIVFVALLAACAFWIGWLYIELDYYKGLHKIDERYIKQKDASWARLLEIAIRLAKEVGDLKGEQNNETDENSLGIQR